MQLCNYVCKSTNFIFSYCQIVLYHLRPQGFVYHIVNKRASIDKNKPLLTFWLFQPYPQLFF